jgi:hypothetical protein
MLATLRRVLSYEFTVAELIGLAIILATPHLLIGLAWAIAHTDNMTHLHGFARVLSFLATIVAWPVLLLTNMCQT